MNNNILQDMFYYYHDTGPLEINSVGCELSQWDAERFAESIPYSLDGKKTILLSTCAVTDSSYKASLLIAERLKLLYPDNPFYICGCGTKFNKKAFEQFGNIIINEDFFLTRINCTRHFKRNINSNDLGYVKVQNGCNKRCAYCIVNQLRGNPYSLSYEDISNQIRILLEQGKVEIELIGTEILQYSYDNIHIDILCSKILEDFPKIKSLSLNACDPSSPYLDRIIELIKKEPRMKPLLYLSVQSGSDGILRRMKRGYKAQRIKDICNQGIPTIWDLVVGFPGESNEDFQETYNLIKELKPLELMICPFSKRPGTKAYTMNHQVPENTIKERVKTLENLVEHNFEQRRPQKETKIIRIDIYDTEQVIKNYKRFSGYQKAFPDKDIVYEVEYQGNKDIFESNVKFLTLRLKDLYIKINNLSVNNKEEFLEYHNAYSD